MQVVNGIVLIAILGVAIFGLTQFMGHRGAEEPNYGVSQQTQEINEAIERSGVSLD